MDENLKEFIKRCMSEQFQKQVKERPDFQYTQWHFKNDENRKKFRDQQKKYLKSEKGKIACKKRDHNRRENFRQACKKVTFKEKLEANQFCKECPEGYVVDHIIPISMGGLHHISNLQYLTKEENLKKGCKIDYVSIE